MKLLKMLLVILGVLLMLVGLFLWSIALSRKNWANWENWDGKIHFQTVLILSFPIAFGIISIAIASRIKRKKSN